jgi:hypothetical protein
MLLWASSSKGWEICSGAFTCMDISQEEVNEFLTSILKSSLLRSLWTEASHFGVAVGGRMFSWLWKRMDRCSKEVRCWIARGTMGSNAAENSVHPVLLNDNVTTLHLSQSKGRSSDLWWPKDYCYLYSQEYSWADLLCSVVKPTLASDTIVILFINFAQSHNPHCLDLWKSPKCHYDPEGLPQQSRLGSKKPVVYSYLCPDFTKAFVIYVIIYTH